MKNGFLLPGKGMLPAYPGKIISLVPSQTELLFDLGIGERVAGITKFCIHPEEWFHTKPRVGGTKTVSLEKIRALAPDLILANKEENVEEQIHALTRLAPVYVSDVHTLEEALDMIETIGMLTAAMPRAQTLITDIGNGFGRLAQAMPGSGKRAAYLIWRNPWMTVGKDTFIHHMMRRAGLVNLFSDKLRYPEITLAEVAARNPDLILLSSEPYPFREKHVPEIKDGVPQASVLLVDGEMFSWYGSRLQYAPGYFKRLMEGHI